MKYPGNIVVLVVVLTLTGCQGILGGGADATATATGTDSLPVYTEQEPDPRWNLAIFYENVTFEEGGTFIGGVATAGHFDGVVYGVKIQFLDADIEVIEEYPVGNLTELGESKYINTTIPTIPVYITIKVDGWDTPGMEPTRMTGQKITQEGSELYIVSDPENFTY